MSHGRLALARCVSCMSAPAHVVNRWRFLFRNLIGLHSELSTLLQQDTFSCELSIRSQITALVPLTTDYGSTRAQSYPSHDG